jgi:glycosyltransferase involved in cell wall biosynthesis
MKLFTDPMKNIILIPAYNEEKNILEVIKRVKKLKKFDKIIVVDDGSTDRTSEIARKAGSIVLRHRRNKGKGEAIKTGFNYIKDLKKWKNVVIIDADLQYKPEESLKLLEKLKRVDFVIGYRNFSKIPLRHRLGNLIWRTTFNFLFRTNLKDTNCGLIGLSKKIIDKIETSGGYIVENCILASVIEKKIKFAQVPVSVTYREKSGILRGVRVVLGVLYFIILRGLIYNFKKYLISN